MLLFPKLWSKPLIWAITPVPDIVSSNCISLANSQEFLAQSWPTLCDPMDCSPPSSSVHGILQARTLEWDAIAFFKGSSQPRGRTRSPAFQADSLPSEPSWKSLSSPTLKHFQENEHSFSKQIKWYHFPSFRRKLCLTG